MSNAEGYDSPEGAYYSYQLAALFKREDRILDYLETWGQAGKQHLHDISHMIDVPNSRAPDLRAWGDGHQQYEIRRFMISAAP